MTRLIKKNTNGDFVSQRMISYDFENRPATITSNGVDTSFEYDYSGMRTLKRSGPSTTLCFGSLYECKDGVCEKHIFAGNSRIATKKSATEIYYYHPDHLGSTRVVTDINGAVVQTDFYDPYGKTRTETGTAALPYKYTGQQEDPETGFYYYKARYYDPVIGRFLTPDPLFQTHFDPPTFPRLSMYAYLPSDPAIYSSTPTNTGGNISAGMGIQSVHPSLGDGLAPMSPKIGINHYTYCANNPLNWVDPTGEIIFNAGAALIGAGIGASIGAVNALFYGGSVWQGGVIGAVTGASAGFTFGTSLLVNAAAGASIGLLGDVTGQVYSHWQSGSALLSNWDYTSTFISTAGGMLGGAGSGLALMGGATVADATLVGLSVAGGATASWSYAVSPGQEGSTNWYANYYSDWYSDSSWTSYSDWIGDS